MFPDPHGPHSILQHIPSLHRAKSLKHKNVPLTHTHARVHTHTLSSTRKWLGLPGGESGAPSQQWVSPC